MQKRFAGLSLASRGYIVSVVAFGAVAVSRAIVDLFHQEPDWRWLVLAVLTLLSGSATLKLPSLPATISVSETFVFTSVILFGAPAGTLTVALDALVISGWSYRRGDPLYKIAFNLFALPLAIWLAAQAYFAIPGVQPIFGDHTVEMSGLVIPLTVLAMLYFLLNSWIITFAIALERHAAPLGLWLSHFAVLSLNYLGGASVAFLLVSYSRDLGIRHILVIAPLLLVFYLTFRWQTGRTADAHRHLAQLNGLYMSTIETLAMAIDAKDQITHGHIRRVQTYAVGLATHLGVKDEALIKAIEAAALLHDMGKLAVPEYILNKPGPLTSAEFEKMKLHSSVGADILSAIDFPYPVVPIVRHHHENWNGTGYPDGLSGTAIPLGARILSVVDCFDALTSDRPYRPKLADKDAIAILRQRSGSMYDPLIVDKFLDVHKDIAPKTSNALPTALHLSTGKGTNVAAPDAAIVADPLDDISSSTEEMLTLFELARGLYSHMSLQDTGDVVVKHLRRLLPSSLVVFFLYDNDTDELVAAHTSGDGAALVNGFRLGVGHRLSGWVAAHRETIRNSDPVLDFGDAAKAISPRLRSCLSVPLLTEGKLVGVLSLYSPIASAFSEDHQRIAEVISNQVSTILKNAAESDQLRYRTHRDRLTGLPTTEHLYEFAANHAQRESLHGPMSVLFLDIDSLAAINRDHGPSTGDDVLRRVVRATRRGLRTADFLFRYRDDEFVVLLLNTDKVTCDAIAARLTEFLRAEALVLAPHFAVTVKTATAQPGEFNVDALIAAASERQEHSGSNRPGTSATDSVH